MRQGLDSLTRYASGSQAVSKKWFSTTENTQHPYMHQKRTISSPMLFSKKRHNVIISEKNIFFCFKTKFIMVENNTYNISSYTLCIFIMKK